LRWRAGARDMVKDLYRYIWRTSARDQILLSVLSACVFLLELAPLELQRRIVNSAVAHKPFRLIGVLCLIYLGSRCCTAGSTRHERLPRVGRREDEPASSDAARADGAFDRRRRR